MLEAGWVQEVKELLDRKYSTSIPAFSSIGFREIADYVQGNASLDDVIERIKIGQHRLVRNQYTWFKLKDPRIKWFKTEYQLADSLVKAIKSFLSDPAFG